MDPARGEEYFEPRLDAIRVRLSQVMKKSNVGDFRGSFACHSDLRRIWWSETHHPGDLVGNRLTDLFGAELTAHQLALLRQRALPLLSYAAWIRVRWRWFAGFPSRAFPPRPPDGSAPPPPISLELPLDLPRLQDVLYAQLDPHHYAMQFWFVPVTLRLTDDAEPQRVPEGCMLPLETQDNGPRHEEGSYGDVYFCRISPEFVEAYPYDGQIFKPVKPYAVAVKVFTKIRDSQQEVDNLVCLKRIANIPGANHPISLHHSIVQYGSPHTPKSLVVFPFADLGNLWQFLNSDYAVGTVGETFAELSFRERFPSLASSPPPPQSPPPPAHHPHHHQHHLQHQFQQYDSPLPTQLRHALLEQCLALAGALRFLHGEIEHRDKLYLLAHMDLKPDNVIISAGGPAYPVGIWKLADFGISVIRTHDIAAATAAKSGAGFGVGVGVGAGAASPGFGAFGRGAAAYSHTIDTTAKRGPSTYQAPEIGLGEYREDERVGVGRKSDVWSFGAIFTEVLAFARGRTSEVLLFRDSKKGLAAQGSKSISDYFWQRAMPRYPGSTGNRVGGSTAASNLQVHARGGGGGPAGPGDSGSYDYDSLFELRDGVVDWLTVVHENDPANQAWVECIGRTLQVNPHKRPQADQLFVMIRNVVYPPPQAANNPAPPPASPPAPTSPHVWSPDPVISWNAPGTYSSSGGGAVATTTGGTPSAPIPIPIPDPRRLSDSPRQVSASPPVAPGIVVAPPPPIVPFPPNHRRHSGRTDSVTTSSSGSTGGAFPPAAGFARLRRIQSNRVEVPRDTRAVSVDRFRVAYLTKDAIRIYVIQPGVGMDAIRQAEMVNLPPAPKRERQVWLGVEVAGDFLACCGKSASGSLLRVFRVVRNQYGTAVGYTPVYFAHPQYIADFDYTKYFTMTASGLIALVTSSGILVLDAAHPTRRPETCGTNQNIFFEDVAFSDDGSYLFATGTGRSCTLLAFRIVSLVTSDSSSAELSSSAPSSTSPAAAAAAASSSSSTPSIALIPAARAAYELDENSTKEFKDGTRVVPLGNELRCLVATARYTRILGFAGPNSSGNSSSSGAAGGSTASAPGSGAGAAAGETMELRPLAATGLVEARLRGLTVHGPRVLLTVEKDGVPCVVQYTLGETASRVGLTAGGRNAFCQLEKLPDTSAEVRAFVYPEAGTAMVLVCPAAGGKIEAVKFALGGIGNGNAEGGGGGGGPMGPGIVSVGTGLSTASGVGMGGGDVSAVLGVGGRWNGP